MGKIYFRVCLQKKWKLFKGIKTYFWNFCRFSRILKCCCGFSSILLFVTIVGDVVPSSSEALWLSWARECLFFVCRKWANFLGELGVDRLEPPPSWLIYPDSSDISREWTNKGCSSDVDWLWACTKEPAMIIFKNALVHWFKKCIRTQTTDAQWRHK